MSITVDGNARGERNSIMVGLVGLFVAFAALFLVYMDLYLLLDARSFRGVADDFWFIYRLSWIAFLVLIVGVLVTANWLIVVNARRIPAAVEQRSGLRASVATVVIVSLIAMVAWVLFVTVHGFEISVVAVGATFGVVFYAIIVAIGGRGSGRSVLIPAVCTLAVMVGFVLVNVLGYVTLGRVAPGEFAANQIELSIIVGVMGVGTLVALLLVGRSVVRGR